MTLPTQEPSQVNAGDALKWKRLASNCLTPAGDQCKASDGWALTYVLVKPDQQIKITAAADGDDYLVDVTPTDSKDYSPGQYSWQAYVFKDPDRYVIANGLMEIRPNFDALEGGYDDRPYIKRMLDAIQATLEKRATKDQSEMLAGNEKLALTPVHRLRELEKEFQSSFMNYR